MKKENWNGHEIRFVEKDGEWWAVLKDITDVLGLETKHVRERLSKGVVKSDTLLTAGGPQELLTVNEFGIYETIFGSKKPEAKEFKQWVFNVIKEMRKQAGLEGFQVFKTLDKNFQKDSMRRLSEGLREPVRIDFIKANTIANRATSLKHGYVKSLKKGDMPPEMLADRATILGDVVELMTVKDKYGLDISVKEKVYERLLLKGDKNERV